MLCIELSAWGVSCLVNGILGWGAPAIAVQRVSCDVLLIALPTSATVEILVIATLISAIILANDAVSA